MSVFVCPLPGPSRKRTETLYRFRLIHEGKEGDECRLIWQCDGGKDLYQQTLAAGGDWECSCPAFTFKRRGTCKHLCAVWIFTRW